MISEEALIEMKREVNRKAFEGAISPVQTDNKRAKREPKSPVASAASLGTDRSLLHLGE